MEGFYKGSKRDLLKGSVRVKGIYGGFCKSQKGCTREAEGFRKASTRIKKSTRRDQHGFYYRSVGFMIL